MTTLKEFKNLIKLASRPLAIDGEINEPSNADVNSDTQTRSRMIEDASD